MDRALEEMLSCFSRSDEALEARNHLGRPLTEDELYTLLGCMQIAEWAEKIAMEIGQA